MNIKHITEKIILKLSQKNQTISFAESCTGGRIASAFTAIPGSSSVLNGSCITYSNEVKHKWLGVTKKTLDNYGAVSKECVYEMLDGIKAMASSDYALAVSGIAGPTGGTKLKPVGTVYIGVLTPTNKIVYKSLFKGDREEIQTKSTIFAIEELAKFLEK